MSYKTVAIFAGSSLPQDDALVTAAETLGAALAQAGFTINYGAGLNGLMGIVAQAALAAGGPVNAFVLERYVTQEQLAGATLLSQKTVFEHYLGMATHQEPRALLMLPGGAGALREAMLGLEAAIYDNGPPVILIRIGRYMDGLMDWFSEALKNGLIGPQHKDRLLCLDVAETMAYLTQKP